MDISHTLLCYVLTRGMQNRRALKCARRRERVTEAGKVGREKGLSTAHAQSLFAKSSPCGRLHIQRYITSYYIMLCKVRRAVNVCSQRRCI